MDLTTVARIRAVVKAKVNPPRSEATRQTQYGKPQAKTNKSHHRTFWTVICACSCGRNTCTNRFVPFGPGTSTAYGSGMTSCTPHRADNRTRSRSTLPGCRPPPPRLANFSASASSEPQPSAKAAPASIWTAVAGSTPSANNLIKELKSEVLHGRKFRSTGGT